MDKFKTLVIMVFLSLPAGVLAGMRDSLPPANSQPLPLLQGTTPPVKTPGQLVSLLIHKPFEIFDRSHSIGFGLDYLLAPRRFAKDATPARKLGWVVKGGVDFFIGRQDAAGGQPFRYSNYLYVHAMGGAIYNPVPFANLLIVTGPGLGIYNNSASAGINTAFAANLFVDQRIAVGPSITFRRHREADALWTVALRIGYALP